MTKIHEAKLFSYSIPFSHADKMRKGLILEIKGGNEQIGWGEIAPLPNWSMETLDLAQKQIQELLSECKNGEFDLKNKPLYPSVRFGLESSLSQLEDDLSSFSLPLNGLLQGPPEEILEKAKELKAQQIGTAKLKVSSLSFQEAKELIDCLKDHFTLRIDVNRAWSYEDSVKFFSLFSPDAFEYIEEPTYDLDRLKDVFFPFALDESLKELLPDCLDYPFLKAVVIKPTLWGDLSLLSSIKDRDIKIVLSSCYETGVGLFSIAKIAKKLSLLSHAHGLDTGRYLTRDIVSPALLLSQGHIHFPSYLKKVHYD
jgi:O-succinylbenzoate synthase